MNKLRKNNVDRHCAIYAIIFEGKMANKDYNLITFKISRRNFEICFLSYFELKWDIPEARLFQKKISPLNFNCFQRTFSSGDES